MRKTLLNQTLLIVLLLPLLGCVSDLPHLTLTISGSFVVTKCETNSTLLVEGIAGTNLAGKTVEIFKGKRKIAEAGTVGPDGTFSVTVGPPNPFKVGDIVIIRIGPDVGQCIGIQPSSEVE